MEHRGDITECPTLDSWHFTWPAIEDVWKWEKGGRRGECPVLLIGVKYAKSTKKKNE